MSELIGSWIDGLAATALPLDDRGLQYGDGLFETVLLRHGRARFLEAHLARLWTCPECEWPTMDGEGKACATCLEAWG